MHFVYFNSNFNCVFGTIYKKLVQMKKNMSTADRIIRLVISAIMIALYFTGVVTGTIGIIMLALAGVFILTSIFSFCPIYAIFGMSSHPEKKTIMHILKKQSLFQVKNE